jgi:SPP1 family predicted phage head-tail adaptor
MTFITRFPFGRLSHRLTLERAVRVADGGGGAEVTWEAAGDMWAAVEAVSGGERIEADRMSGEVNALITIRYREDIVPAMRFRTGSQIFHILTVLDGDGAHRFLRCQCQRRDL